MSKFEKVLKIAAVIVAVVLIGVVLGWLGGRGKPMPQLPPTPTTGETAANTSTNGKDAPSSLKKAAKSRPHLPQNNLAASVATQPANLMTNWEDKLDQILGGEGNDADKAKEMLAMFPNLPEDGQAEVAQHLSNLTPDENYTGLGQYLTNSTVSEAVLDVLLADLLNRPNSVKLPMLYEVARQGDQNPKASDAKDILQLYLDEDYGDNWQQWQAKMEQWLKDNPD
jgi:hypothetical protein